MSTEKGETVSAMRSFVVEQFISIEAVVCTIIGAHYFGTPRLDFYTEVLYDEYFSFGLKARVLEKILPSEDKDAERFIRRLRRLNVIRNYFAHCGVLRHDSASGAFSVPDPRKPEGSIDFAALHREFMELLPQVRSSLFALAKKEGVKMWVKKQGTWVEPGSAWAEKG
jgi:hypothetical protein